MLSCLLCDKECDDWETLNGHLKASTKHRDCKKCRKGFINYEAFAQHCDYKHKSCVKSTEKVDVVLPWQLRSRQGGTHKKIAKLQTGHTVVDERLTIDDSNSSDRALGHSTVIPGTSIDSTAGGLDSGNQRTEGRVTNIDTQTVAGIGGHEGEDSDNEDDTRGEHDHDTDIGGNSVAQDGNDETRPARSNRKQTKQTRTLPSYKRSPKIRKVSKRSSRRHDQQLDSQGEDCSRLLRRIRESRANAAADEVRFVNTVRQAFGPLLDETEQKERSRRKGLQEPRLTPDILFPGPVKIFGGKYQWIEYKSFHGSSEGQSHIVYSKNLRQFKKYAGTFGSGLVVYGLGHTQNVVFDISGVDIASEAAVLRYIEHTNPTRASVQHTSQHHTTVQWTMPKPHNMYEGHQGYGAPEPGSRPIISSTASCCVM